MTQNIEFSKKAIWPLPLTSGLDWSKIEQEMGLIHWQDIA